MVKFKTRVASLDEVADEQVSARTLYREATEAEGGGFILDAETAEGWAVENVQGLRSALGKFKNTAEKAELKLAEYKLEDGNYLDPKSAATLADELEKLKANAGKGSKELEEQLAALRGKYDEKMKQQKAEHDAVVAKKDALIHKEFKVNRINLATGGKVKSLSIFTPAVANMLDLVEENGSLDLRVLDGDGGHRITEKKGGGTGFMGVDELVQDVLPNDPEFAPFFKGSGASGGGTAGGDGTGKPDGNKTTVGPTGHITGVDIDKVASGEHTIEVPS